MKAELSRVFTPFAKVNPFTYGIVVATWVVGLLFMWTVAATGSAVVPTLTEIAKSMVTLITEGGLIRDIIVSVVLAVESVVLTGLISLVVCYFATLPVGKPLAQLVAALRFLSFVGIATVVTVSFGGGHTLKVCLLVFGMTVYFVTSMFDIIAEAQNNLNALNHARTLGMSEWRVLWEVIVIGKLPAAFEVMKQNFAVAFMMLVTVEGLNRSEGGLGTVLLDNNKHMNMDAVFAVQIIVLAIGLLMDFGLGWSRKAIFKHVRLQKR